jgi:hypothetical protein
VFFVSAFSTTMQRLRALLAPSGHPSVLFLLLYNIRPRVQILAERIEHKIRKKVRRLGRNAMVDVLFFMGKFAFGQNEGAVFQGRMGRVAAKVDCLTARLG